MAIADDELERLLGDLESDRAERTQSVSDTDKFRQAICAFANDLPDHRQSGALFIGVDDHGKPTGIAITDHLLLNLASMKMDGNIVPFPTMTVQKRRLHGSDVAVVLVEPSDYPPVRFKGTVWVRVGPRRDIATPEDERRLAERRRYRDLPADVRPVVSAKLDDLDELLFRRVYLGAAVSAEVIEENQRTLEEQLLAVRFAHPGVPACPTVLGLLTVGKSPSDWIAGAYIQFVRIEGTHLTDSVQSATEIRGALPQLMSSVDELLRVNIRTAVEFANEPVEVRSPDYPLGALQQLVRNAVLHRSYENTNAPVRVYWFADRVEIHNPGGPYGQVTKSNFGQPGVCDYRNPNLAGVLKELGYVQRFGMGIPLARKEMEDNGNPPPEFLVEQSYVAVVLRRRQ